MDKKNVWVSKTSDGKWSVKKEGNEKSSGKFDTQKQAEGRGRDLAKKEKSELIVKNKEGKIRKKDSFGNDDFPPKG